MADVATGPRDAQVLPGDEEIDRILLEPGGLAWRVLADPRLFFGAGYALLMQVAHPTVGSGVRDHSDFEERPWDRLLRRRGGASTVPDSSWHRQRGHRPPFPARGAVSTETCQHRSPCRCGEPLGE